MTSSFSTMLLTALSIFDKNADAKSHMRQLAKHAEAVLPLIDSQIRRFKAPKRTVFVGSGPMTFAARECALKVMELSAGKIPALWDSTLGFRHGPKSFISSGTAIYVLRSTECPTTNYEVDLVEELRMQFPEATTMTIGAEADLSTNSIGYSAWDTVLSVLPAQLASVIWSSQLGLNIDDPFMGQSTLTRVVSGVRLHPVQA
jgi:tagatose-6-phosphate ketose/aldose isomerase